MRRVLLVLFDRSGLEHAVNVEHGEHELGKSAAVRKATSRFFVTLKAGTYIYYCSVPGHEDAGMHGTLIAT
jgi:plastocyanin